jgi:hypothetical protein
LSKPYRLNIVKGIQKTRVLYKTLLLKIKIKEEETNVIFNIIPIIKNIILGDL